MERPEEAPIIKLFAFLTILFINCFVHVTSNSPISQNKRVVETFLTKMHLLFVGQTQKFFHIYSS